MNYPLSFYAPESLPGASSNRIVHPSVCLCIIPSRLHCAILKVWVAIKLPILQVHLRVTHTSLTSHAPWVGGGQNVKLWGFARFWLCCRRGFASTSPVLNQVQGLIFTESYPLVHIRQAYYTINTLTNSTGQSVFLVNFMPLWYNLVISSFGLPVSLSCLFRATTLTLSSPLKNKIFHFKALKLTKTRHQIVIHHPFLYCNYKQIFVLLFEI